MIDLKKMLEAGVHFGHKTSRWSPKMRPYIWGAKNKVHLIDVSKTAVLLERAGKLLTEVTTAGKKVLFVGTKKAAQDIIKNVANTNKMPYVIHRWVGGTLSNYDQVKKAITRLLHMRDVLQKPTTHYKKKEISMIQKEVARLEKNVGGIVDFDYPPAAIVVVDVKKEHSAVKEASRLGIPVIALVDTNSDPEGVSIIIPTNDDSPKAINFIMDYINQAVAEGCKAHEAAKLKLRTEQQEARKAAQKAPAPTPAAAPEAKKVEPRRPEQPAVKAAPKVDAAKVVEKKAPATAAPAPKPAAVQPAPKPATTAPKQAHPAHQEKPVKAEEAHKAKPAAAASKPVAHEAKKAAPKAEAAKAEKK